jgi:hypothetical protein
LLSGSGGPGIHWVEAEGFSGGLQFPYPFTFHFPEIFALPETYKSILRARLQVRTIMLGKSDEPNKQVGRGCVGPGINYVFPIRPVGEVCSRGKGGWWNPPDPPFNRMWLLSELVVAQ